MSDATFPSGQWVGFFTYGKESQRHLMDLILEFKNGFVTGEGSDEVGFFHIGGRYYPEELECFWTKTYHRRHSVEYTGFREAKGIWGTWELGHHSKGGFHIWPIGETGPHHEQKEVVEAQEEEEKRLDAPLPVPAAPDRMAEPEPA